jgi:ATP-binding cassette subfamily F protein 3
LEIPVNLIYLKNISLSFADQKIFDNISLAMPDRSRVGLVGDNGAGKTTLLKAIIGIVELDSGSIEISDRNKIEIGYLPQDLVELEPVPLLEFLRMKSGIAELERELSLLEKTLSYPGLDDNEYDNVLADYQRKTALFDAKNGYAFETRAKQMLSGFGFRDSDFNKNCVEFSGGWRMRILLSSILLTKTNIMLLDEPTNHLDTESMEWLESLLKNYPGTIITIAHDRIFLDKTVDMIADLAGQKIEIYKGNYSYYLQEKVRRQEAVKKEMELQRARIKRINEFVERFRYKATKASQVQSRIKMLEKFGPYRKEEKDGKTVVIHFPENPKSPKEVLSARRITKSYGDLNVFHALNFTLYRGQKAAVVGINGAGKSTLLRILSGVEQPSSGEIIYGTNVKMAFFSQEISMNLDYDHTVWEEVNAAGTKSNDQQRRNLLGAFLFSGDDIYKKISVLSGGEKSRLALLKILLEETNLLILDEPTNHLDIKTKEVFQNALLNYRGTVLIVSHDRYFLNCLAGRIFELKDGVCYEYNGNYTYFIEKRVEMQSASTHALCDSPADMKRKNAYINSRKSKEEKRLEAEERNRISRATAHLKNKLNAAEERISLLEKKKKEMEDALCQTETYKQPDLIKKLNLDLKTIDTELEDLYYEWNDLTLEIKTWEESSAEKSS